MRTFMVSVNSSTPPDLGGRPTTQQVDADRYTLDPNGALIFYKNSPVAVTDVVIRCWADGIWRSFWEVNDEL